MISGAGAAALLAALALLAAEGDAVEPVSLRFPGASWAVALDLPGFTVGPTRERPDGSGVERDAFDDETGLMVSIVVERAAPGDDAEIYRELLWNELQVDSATRRTHVERASRYGSALLEYRVSNFRGLDVQQLHIHALQVRDGLRVHVHLSHPHSTPADGALFRAVLRSLRMLETPGSR